MALPIWALYMKEMLNNPDIEYSLLEEFDIPEEFNPNAGCQSLQMLIKKLYCSFFTLLIGVIFNFIMGVTASKLMLKGVSRFKCFRNPVLYGGVKND